MDEKPKSIWKKSITGRTAWVFWLAVAAFTVMLGCFIVSLLEFNRSLSQIPLAVGIFTGAFLAICLVLVYVVWPLLRWLFWKHWRGTLFALACFATFIALFYAEENWRGRHDWEEFKNAWAARGEHFDYASVIPPPVPENQNFAFSPVWIAEEKFNFLNRPDRARAWYGERIDDAEVLKMISQIPVSTSGLVGTNWMSQRNLPSEPQASGNWVRASVTDLKPWQAYYRDLQTTYPGAEIPTAPQPQTPAQDVLLALSKFSPVIDELKKDSALPYSRFPVQYDTDDPAAILLPHLAAIKRISLVLHLRAIAELQNGETDRAFEDVKLMLRLVDSVHTEPWMISHLVRIAILEITIQPIYEGLAEHKWADTQLTELNSELARLDFLADYEKSLRADVAATDVMIDYVKAKPSRFWNFSDWGQPELKEKLNRPSVAMEIYLMPKGWWEQNKIVIAKVAEQYLLAIVDTAQHTVSPQKSASAQKFQNSLKPTPFNLLSMILAWPGIGNYAEKIAHGQSAADLSRIAIALERYRLAHGEYPESLDALAPQLIAQVPHDVIGGQPLHYRRTDDQQIVLYSVGWNETDDGGVVVLNKGNSPSVDISQGDWVWRYPQKSSANPQLLEAPFPSGVGLGVTPGRECGFFSVLLKSSLTNPIPPAGWGFIPSLFAFHFMANPPLKPL